MPERDPRYDILFEPVKIGPLTAKNRFFQVPHWKCLIHLPGHLFYFFLVEEIHVEGGPKGEL